MTVPDEVVVTIAGEPYWLWRAVDQNGFVLDVLVQRRRDSRAAQRLIRKLLKSAGAPPRVMITDKLRSYGAARVKMGLCVEHRQRGKLSPADEATRTDHEAIQIGQAGTTVSVGSRSSREPLPHPLSPIRPCRLPPRFARASLCRLARDLPDGRYCLTPPLRKIASLRPGIRSS